MPAKLFQKGREEGNTFPYLCQVLNPIDGQYHSTCHFHWSPDFTGPVQSLSLISVEMTLLLVPALRELRDVFDICKKYSLLHMHWAEVGLVLSLDIMWGGLLMSLRLWQCLNRAVSEMWGWFFAIYTFKFCNQNVYEDVEEHWPKNGALLNPTSDWEEFYKLNF